MKALKIFAMALLMIFIAQGRTFAEMPEISAGETYFDISKGVYVLKGNVYVATNNHGFRATITADEAQVSVVKQKCWATGNVKLAQENIIFSCDRAYLQWQTRTAEVTGNVKFKNKKSVAINSDTAIFNWKEKIVDFYGKVTLNGEEFQHVKYNIVEDRILSRDKTFNAPNITIPNVDGN
ncbi:MAG: hypothetical protein IKZ53_00560 [Selenomonadaceae bacterium]|nr:hypothetical protein [Selenomonadaceae bacterium]